jgi:CheY-like chemotaxis protein
VENISNQDLAKKLLLGERQIRRSQKKAVQAAATQLWDRLSVDKQEQSPQLPPSEFVINLELINLDQVLNGILKLLNSRFNQEEVEVVFTPSDNPNLVFSDRIILRQILIGILNLLLQKEDLNQIQIQIKECEETVCLEISAPQVQLEKDHVMKHLKDQENSVTQWANELNLEFNEYNSDRVFHFEMIFAKQEKKLILVVDDQEPALRMYQRYLSKSNYKVYGLSKATKVISKAIELKPSLILLDIMMPKVDGWEILQSLRLNDKTKHIPIIVCSAWGEPELAKSLGANHFLRKPIVQRELLDVLEALVDV